MSLRSRRGNVALRVALVVLALALLTWFLSWFFRTDYQRISETIDAARDALVEGRDDEFLGYFEPGVVYRERYDHEKLAHDLARWRQMGLSSVHIPERTIEVHPDGTADVRLVVAAGTGFPNLARVDVTIAVRKSPEGRWLVSAFQWSR